jgi:hypothetical protein
VTGLADQMSNFMSGGAPAGGGSTFYPGSNTWVDWSAPAGGDVSGMLAHGLTMGSAASDLFGGLFNAFGTLQKGQQEASSLRMAAAEQDLQAQQEEIKGKQGANNIMDNLIQVIASQRLAASANGIDPSFGTPNAVASTTITTADRQIDATRTNAMLNSLVRRRQAASDLWEAGNVSSSSFVNAGAAGFSGAVKAFGDLADAAQVRINRG